MNLKASLTTKLRTRAVHGNLGEKFLRVTLLHGRKIVVKKVKNARARKGVDAIEIARKLTVLEMKCFLIFVSLAGM